MAIQLSKKQKQEGWTVVKFGQIAREVKSTTSDPAADSYEFYVGLEHLDPQSLRIVRKGVIADDNPTFTRCFAAGHILFGKRRSYQKKAAVADFDGICSGDIIVMEAIPDGEIVPELLPFIVQSDGFFDWAVKTSMGSLSPRTKWSALAEYEFALPPLDRQRGILELLEKVEECDTNYVATSQSIVSLYDVMTRNLFSSGLLPKCNLKKTAIGKIPEHWAVVPFGTLLRNGTQNGLYKEQDLYGSGKKMVHMVDMFRTATIFPEQVEQCVELTEQEILKYTLHTNDLLFARRSLTPEGAGLCCMYIGQSGEVSIESSIIRVTLNDDLANPFFYNHFLRSRIGRWHLGRIIQTVAASGITGTDLKNFKVPLPPIGEQNAIVNILDNVKRIASDVGCNSRKLNQLSKSITKSLLEYNAQIEAN